MPASPRSCPNLLGDERNVLLTLARMVLTVETGHIASKDEAVEWILPSLREPHISVLTLAAMGYAGYRMTTGLGDRARRATPPSISRRG